MSTAMLSQPVAVSIPTTMAAAPAPTSPTKKRRRRAPATGAAEDCFTCRSHGVKCDRRRPYCGPCLDSNQNCNGYRTQLTWGVGVASRGKLRGMSLPVINAVTEQQRKDRMAKRAEEKAGLAEEKAKKMRTVGAGTPGYGPSSGSSLAHQQQRNSPSLSNIPKQLSIITNYDFVNMEPPLSASSTSSAIGSSIARSASAMSAPLQSAHSPLPPMPLSAGGVPVMAGLQSQRMSQEKRSPQSNMSSPYSTISLPAYHSPVLSHPPPSPHHHHIHQQHQHQQHQHQQHQHQHQHQQHHQQHQQQHHDQQQRHHPLPSPMQPAQQQQHYATSPTSSTYVKSEFQKAPYPQVTMSSQAPSIILSPMPEYENFSSHSNHTHTQPSHSHNQQYSMSSAPTSTQLYDIVSSTYHPSQSTTVTSSGVSFSSVPASMPAPRMMPQQHQHHHNGSSSWNAPNVGGLHQQHVPSGHNNLSDLLYDEDIMSSF
jgi:hypothetical protein